MEIPKKNHKFAASDITEREHWEKYMFCYEEMIRNTSTRYAPWYTVPADNKWFARLIVSSVVIDALKSMHLTYPVMDAEKMKEMLKAKRALAASTKT